MKIETAKKILSLIIDDTKMSTSTKVETILDIFMEDNEDESLKQPENFCTINSMFEADD